MIDDGCTVEGYQSDITRTFVLGKATDKMKKVFDIVHQAQTAALKAREAGRAARGRSTPPARKVVVDAGYGPGFKYFTHRLGHGMGMDGHEWPYLVKNNMYGWEKALKAAAGHGVQRRTGHLHQRRIRRAARRRHAHHRRTARNCSRRRVRPSSNPSAGSARAGARQSQGTFGRTGVVEVSTVNFL